MSVDSKTIKEVMESINVTDREGGIFLPYIQRDFVWSEAKICDLMDSLMKGYPIGTFLGWKTKKDLDCRPFVTDYSTSINFDELVQKIDEKHRRIYILDGQQRLQGIYLALKGSYKKKELYFNITSSDEVYEFKFPQANEKNLGWIFCSLKKLIEYGDTSKVLSALKIPTLVAGNMFQKIRENLDRFYAVYESDRTLVFQYPKNSDHVDMEMDSISEIFVRANSGGVVLEKSDLMMAMIKKVWISAPQDLAGIHKKFKEKGFKKTKDFVLRSFLAIYGKGTKLLAAKLTKDAMEYMQQECNNMGESILDVMDTVADLSFIGGAKEMSLWEPLFPLIICRHYQPKSWARLQQNDQHELKEYLLHSYLSNAFFNKEKSLKMIDALCNEIKQHGFSMELVEQECAKQKCDLSLDPNILLNENYKTPRIKMFLYFLYYYWIFRAPKATCLQIEGHRFSCLEATVSPI